MTDSDLTGGWCWFQEPRAVATDDHTFVGWTEYDDRGTVSVARYDHERGTFDLHRGVGETPGMAPDDHNSPALFVRPDGRVEVFYTAHNSADGNRYRVSEEPLSVASFGPERSIPDDLQSTYPMPCHVPATDERWYFYRDSPGDGSPSTFYYYRSTDGGETWSDRRRLFDIDGDDYSGYVKVAAGDERIDVCYSRHPRPAPLERCDVRHCYYDATDDQFRDSHGAPIEPPVRESDMTCLFDAASAGERGWIWDVQSVDGRPVIVFASFTDGDERDQRYHYATYADGSWTVSEVCETDHLYATYAAGEANELEYAPGISLGHPQGEDVLYLSRNPEPRTDRRRGLQVEEWRVDDGGEAFRRERVVATGEESNQFRPIVPRAARGGDQSSPIRTLWMRGQSSAPYHYHDEECTVHLAAEVETADGTETVDMRDWAEYRAPQ